MKRFILAIMMVCVLSVTALAGEVSTTGAPAPGDISTPGLTAPGDVLIPGLTMILDLLF